ncbi:hypothetical protein [Aquimarina rubra]|uniref:Uncharacterized protein n=1 Tax=Aquimarina rubra TaxID=1920033 RepID=A0ABW5LD18_9FLAO
MAHPKITRTRTFVDDFEETLSLSLNQVHHIDELTYLYLKENKFSIDPNYEEKKARFRYFLSIARTLDDAQKRKLKTIKQDQKEKQASFNFETIKSERYLKKYKSLNLSENRYQQFRIKLDEIEKLSGKMFDESMTNHKLRKPYHQRFKEAANNILKDFFTLEELKTFNEIEEKDYQFIVDTRTGVILQGYASTLDLNKKQATQIFLYEENEPILNEKNKYLSEWEKLDLYKQFMKSLLSKEQFDRYQPIWNERKSVLEEGIISNNQSKKQEITRLQNKKQFLLTQYLPALCNWRSEIETLLDKNLKRQLSVLKTVYQEKIISIYTKHKKEAMRRYKDLFPNHFLQLEIELQLKALIPNAGYLEDTGDIFSYISPELRKVILESIENTKNIRIALNEFEIENYENTGGTYGGWTIVKRHPRNERSENLHMLSMLLLDSEPENNITAMNKVLHQVSG